MHLRKLAIGEVDGWQPVSEEQQIFVADLIDLATNPDARMTVGFARLAKGESLTHTFPYDEVLVLTRGRYSIRSEDGETVTAGPGEVIYLPAGSTNVSHAHEDTEMVYVASPPDVYADHVAQAAADAGNQP